MYKLPNGKLVYPEDIQCVHDPINGKGGIFIGNLESAQNLNTLNKHSIKAVLTACKGTFLNHSKKDVPYQLYIPGQDHERFDLSKYFSQSIKFIHEALQSTNILVHCLGGVSRSVTLVMAYFIKYNGMTYDQVYSKIKAKRKIIYPNDSFIDQLKKFEYQLKQKGQFNSSSPVDKYEIRSSYSPAKNQERRAHLRGYEGNQHFVQHSTKKYYQSPQQRYSNLKNSEYFGYNQASKNNNCHNIHSSSIKNPEFHRSTVQELQQVCRQKLIQNKRHDNIRSHYSPQKYSKYDNKMRSGVGCGLKRLSSMNVDLTRHFGNQNAKKGGQLLHNYDNPRQMMKASQYQQNPKGAFQNIQNRQSIVGRGSTVNVNVDDIDKKIAEIKKKYQDVASKYPEEKKIRPSSIYERKYSNMSDHNQNYINKYDDFLENRVKNTPIDNERGIGGIRQNYVTDSADNIGIGGGNSTMNRLKRMQSYQA